MSDVRVYVGDCRQHMALMAPESIDACVTDPPYHLTDASRTGSARVPGTGPFGRHRVGERGFMGKTWDGGGVAFDPAMWAAVFRVLKPGGRLLAFGGSRTHHRIWCAIENAGFVIEDTIMWLYGSGFPKHKSKLKPAFEPVCIARKGGVSELNIDACRISWANEEDKAAAAAAAAAQRTSHVGLNDTSTFQRTGDVEASIAGYIERMDPGRWPANVVLDEDAAAELDEQSGELTSGANPTRRGSDKFRGVYQPFAGQRECVPARGEDVGGASRFYYVAKPSRAERDAGLEGLPKRPAGSVRHGTGSIGSKEGRDKPHGNDHPTVKPVDLMRWLVRLVTQPGHLVLDPFTGSGTTGVACVSEGRRFIGIEQDAGYAAIARRRIAQTQPTLFDNAAPLPPHPNGGT